MRNLLTLLQETRALISQDGNDFSWSSWRDQDHALFEMDAIIAEVEKGSIPEIGVLFAPTGPIQEVSLRSGRGNEFLELAERFDKEYAIVRNQS